MGDCVKHGVFDPCSTGIRHPSALRLISQDELVSVEEVQERGKEYFVIQAVVAHKELSKGNYVYRVRWEGYDEKDDTWQAPESFSTPKPIAEYWERLGRSPTIATNKAGATNAKTVNKAALNKRSKLPQRDTP